EGRKRSRPVLDAGPGRLAPEPRRIEILENLHKAGGPSPPAASPTAARAVCSLAHLSGRAVNILCAATGGNRMSFQVRQETRPVTNGLDPAMYVLEHADGSCAEIWPALGCNCYRWRVPWRNGLLDLLYAAPTLYSDTRPTRSGIPVLFPF